MELKHRFTVPASVDTTWQLFNDLERVAPCFPGAALTSAQGDEFAGTVKVKLGPVSLQYSGAGRFLERDEAAHVARFEAKGKDKRGNGTASATVRAVLSPDGSGTAVEVSTDLAVTGKPAQFGRGLMQDVSDKLLARFVDCLTERLSSAGGEPEEPAEGVAQPPAARVGAEPTGARPADAGQVDARPTETAPAAAPTTPARHRVAEPAGEEAELDLGATVLPVLARRYGPAVLVALVLLLVLRRLLRR